MDERLDIDVGYRDPDDRRDDFPEDKPSPAEYEDRLAAQLENVTDGHLCALVQVRRLAETLEWYAKWTGPLGDRARVALASLEEDADA